MRLFRRIWLPSLLISGAWLVPSVASAVPSLALLTTQITRKTTLRGQGITNGQNRDFWISRADCEYTDSNGVPGDVITIPFTVQDPGNYALQVWTGPGGTDCTAPASRTAATMQCKQVYSITVQKTTPEPVQINVRDILSYPARQQAADGGTSICDPIPGESSSPQPVTLTFMFVESNINVIGNPVPWQTSFDLLGPAAPSTDLSIGPGDGFLKASWPSSLDPDLNGYILLCDPPQNKPTPSAQSFSRLPGLSSVLDTVCDAGDTSCEAGASGDGGDAAAEAEASAKVEAGACSSTSDSGSDDAADGDAGDADASQVESSCASSTPPVESSADSQQSDPDAASGVCTSQVFAAGTIPTAEMIEKYKCGGASGPSAIEGKADGLTNNTTYRVAIAATDLIGNIGPLSKLQCGRPQRVDDFYKLYKQDGGGGEGFCSASAVGARKGSVWAGLSFGLAAIALSARARTQARSKAARKASPSPDRSKPSHRAI